MIWPPSLARIRVVEGGRTKISLWLPLILIWPPVLVLWLVLLPLIVVVALVLWPSGRGRLVLLGGPLAFYVFCAARGLEARIDTPNENVQVYFW